MHIKQKHISNTHLNLIKEHVSPTHGMTERKNNETPTRGIVHPAKSGTGLPAIGGFTHLWHGRLTIPQNVGCNLR